MLTLPQGITGFDITASTDTRRFRADLYAATRSEDIAISQPLNDQPDDVRTFVTASITFRETELVVLLNVYATWLAFTEPTELDDPEYRFVDIPRLPPHLTRYTTPSAESLRSIPTDDCLIHLSGAERKQFRYWNPARIGDIVYNSWD